MKMAREAFCPAPGAMDLECRAVNAVYGWLQNQWLVAIDFAGTSLYRRKV